MTTSSYTADIDAPKGSARCSCNGGCDWEGPARDTVDIDDCVLTPGDASPVGRCPQCGTLAYLDEPDHWNAAINATTSADAIELLRKHLNIPYDTKVDTHISQIGWPRPSDKYARMTFLLNWLQLTALTRRPDKKPVAGVPAKKARSPRRQKRKA